jgi:glutamine transport system permease protein
MSRQVARLLLTGLLLLPLLTGCSNGRGNNFVWGWYILDPRTAQGQTNLNFLLGGVWATLAVSLTAILLSVLLGVALAIAGLSSRKWLQGLNRTFIELVRAVPVLVLLLWVYYGIPVIVGLQLDVFTAGLISLALSDSAFEAEIFRAGIQSVPPGQREAAGSLGLSWLLTLRLIILPQAVRRILPALGNQFIYMLKMSSLLSVIGFQELTRRANELTVTEYRPLEIYTALVGEYLILILIVSRLVRWLERRLGSAHG